MRSFAIGLGVLVALAAHLFLGWMWSLAGPLLTGFLMKKGGAWAGAVSLTLSWALLIVWNLAVATAESFNMMETMGSLLGGMPGVVIPVATLLMAALLGLVAGSLGAALKPRPSS